jgi:hypothetical protein
MPGLVGAPVPFSDAHKLSWSPPASEKNQMILIPVEVDDDNGKLIRKASLYAKALYSPSPLRQFALVIGYNHRAQKLTFFVFPQVPVIMSE